MDEQFLNIQFKPKPIYDNPPGADEDAEQFPILAYRSYENPVYNTTEDNVDLPAGATGDRDDIPYQKPKYKLSHLFSVTVCFTEIVGIVCIVTTVCWIMFYRQGLGWDTRPREFNAHPVFMVVGLVFFYANAALSSYVLRNKGKVSSIHFYHLVSVVLTFVMTSIGFASGIEVKRSFYSLHSWIGLLTLFLFSAQVVIGFLALFPKCEDITRKRYLKFQMWIFLCVFILSLVACVTGISNYLRLESIASVVSFSWEGLLTNVLTLLLILFGILVSSVLFHPVYRQP